MTIASEEQNNNTVAYLVALDSSFSNRTITLPENGITLGRDKNKSEIVLSDQTISRQHLTIQKCKGDGAYYVIDHNSSNGTFVNQERITLEQRLNNGDILGLGSSSAQHLRFYTGSNQNQSSSYQLSPQKRWLVGRGVKADISLSFDPTVSASHAWLTHEQGQLFVEDLNSLNGTYINGQKVHCSEVNVTDILVIGSTYFHFCLEGDNSLLVSQRGSGDDIQLECVDLTRDVTIGWGGKKCILHHLTLQIGAGEFVGILGPSGAGKSTLLKAICGHTVPDSGCVFLNETPLYQSYEMFKGIIGYVPQDDILHLELSVEKSLEFVARLRLPNDFSSGQRKKIVQTTLETLGLSHVKDSPIERLSGGQRKRVSIGAELITRPSILFLDEPTSGLDPSVEERLMTHFQNMADKGTTVLITTHILYNLSMLDKIVFMAQGHLVFYGTPDEAMQFFNEGEDGRITRPTEIFDLLEGRSGDVISSGGVKEIEEKEVIANHFAKKYYESTYFTKYVLTQLSPSAKEMFSLVHSDDSLLETKKVQLQKLHDVPQSGKWSFSQLKSCISFREWFLLSIRHVNIRFASIKLALIYLLIPVILSLVTLTQSVNGFLDEETIEANKNGIVISLDRAGPVVKKQIQVLLSPDSSTLSLSAAELIHAIKYEGVVNLPVPMGVLLMFVMSAIFMGTFVACQEISSETSIRYREQMAGQRVFDYIGSKLSFCVFITAIQCTLYLGICYFLPGLQVIPYINVLYILLLVAWTSVAMGLFLSAIDPTSGKIAIILTIIVVLPQLILSGGLGPDFYEGMNVVTRVIANVFPAKWGLELFLTVIYQSDAGSKMVWIPPFVTETIGFHFGDTVLVRDKSLLCMQMISWLFLTALVLKKKT